MYIFYMKVNNILDNLYIKLIQEDSHLKFFN